MDDDDILGFKDEDFPVGSIRKIVFNNFLTYGHVVVKPGPHMNVIVGPNGTGKSTVICGICLASGGSPKLLGRSDKMDDFISHGEHEGSVEMHLHDPDANNKLVVFKIVIRRPSHVVYYLNGRHVKKEIIRQNSDKYNIQVDNPCTFLAQDKVKSFAEQEKGKLLINTQKAGPEELTKHHETLKNLSQNAADNASLKEQHEKKLKRVREDLVRVKVLAENYEERQRRNAHLLAFKDKLIFLKCQIAHDDHKNKNEKTREVKNKMDEIDAEMKVVVADIKKAHKAAFPFEKTSGERLEDAVRSFDDNVEKVKSCFTNEDIFDARSSLKVLQADLIKWEKSHSKTNEMLKQMKAELEQSKSEIDEGPLRQKNEERQQIAEKIKREDRSIDTERHELLTKKTNAEATKQRHRETVLEKLQKISSITKNKHIFEAWKYFNQNQNLFRYPVFLPFLSVVIHENNLIYFNNVISPKDLAMFVFGCREDEKTMVDRGFRINTTVVDARDKFEFNAVLPSELRAVGFIDYLINMVQAPPPVIAYLNNVARLDVIPVGNDNVDQKSEEYADRFRQLRTFLTKRHRIDVITSYYDRNRLNVKRSNLRYQGSLSNINSKPMESNVQHVLDEVNAKLNSLEDRRKSEEYIEMLKEKQIIENACETLRKECNRKKDDVQRQTMDLDKLETSHQLHIVNKPNVERAERRLKRLEEQERTKLFNAVEKVVIDLQNQFKAVKQKISNSIELNRIRQSIDFLKKKRNTLSKSFDGSKNELDQCQYDEKEALAELNKHLEILAKTTKISHLNQSKFSAAEKVAYERLLARFEQYRVPDTIKECEKLIINEEVRTEIAQLDGTSEDVTRFAELVKEEKALEAQLIESQTTIDNWENEMKVVLEKWIPPLQELVNQISNSFSAFFAKIAGAGEVVLFKPDNPLDIGEYGIDIYVQFRSHKKLHLLTASKQSGGERSVSTMLYLMALQDLCVVPFRCVDEINQGMDPSNERLVFNMMVELIGGTGHLSKTQYFILTPKLLHGLNFTDKVTTLIVQNTFSMSNGPDTLAMYDDSGEELENGENY